MRSYLCGHPTIEQYFVSATFTGSAPKHKNQSMQTNLYQVKIDNRFNSFFTFLKK